MYKSLRMFLLGICSFIVSGKRSKAMCLVAHTQPPNQLCKIHLQISQQESSFNAVTLRRNYLVFIFSSAYKPKQGSLPASGIHSIIIDDHQTQSCANDHYLVHREEVLSAAVTNVMSGSFNREQPQAAQSLIDWRGRESERETDRER